MNKSIYRCTKPLSLFDVVLPAPELQIRACHLRLQVLCPLLVVGVY